MAITTINGGTQIRDATITPAKVTNSFILTTGANAFAANQSMGGFKLTNLAAPISGTDAVNKTYVDNSVTGLLDFKGSTDASASPNYPAALKGDAYFVSVAGKIGGASGKSVDIGDVYVASLDNAGGTEASVGTSWFVLEHNLVGALVASNNLSDLASPSAALANLGIAFANPTASVGLTTVNGSALTYMRSDAAPPLNQAIVPTMTGSWTFAKTVGTGTQTPSITITGPAHTALTASTESNGLLIDFSATKQFATGAITNQREILIKAPTYSAVAVSTITSAATMEISGPPIAGVNVTISKPWALKIASGNVAISDLSDGSILFSGPSGIISQDNTKLYFDDTNNRLCVGTNSSISTLTVVTAASNYGLTHSDGTHKIATYVDTNGGWLGTASNHSLQLMVNGGAARILIGTNGNVAVGMTAGGSPSTTFVVYDGTRNNFAVNNAPGTGYLVSIHAANDSPFALGVFNDLLSTTVPAFGYFAWTSGPFEQGTHGAYDMIFYTNGYANGRMVINSTGLVQIGSGINVSSGSASATTPGAQLDLRPVLATTIGQIIKGAASASANLQEWRKSDDTIYTTISENGYFTTRKIAAAADGELASSELSLWFDDTNGAGKLMVKAKTANGTVVTGSLTLV